MNKIINTSQGTAIVDQLERKYQINIDGLIFAIKSYNKEFNEEKFRQAFMFAAFAHNGQMRKQENIPYIVHPLETAKILTQIHADETTLIAALLHDVPEDTNFTLDQISEVFGKQVAFLVEGITKLSKVHYRHNMQQREVESMKKLFVHVSEDPRTMLIKLADRLHNMRTLEYMDVPEKRLRKARETLEIFTPIANLLGIKELQTELEDLCFQNLYPEDFHKLSQIVSQARDLNRSRQTHMIEKVEQVLKDNQIDAIVYPYQNNLYDIYKRLKNENKQIDDYEISFSFNIIVEEVSDCYKTLGLIHGTFRPKPNCFNDYISLPKANGYQSLNTTVFGEGGIITKICIRTNQMHFEAQYGIAASYFSNHGTKKKLFIGHDPRSQWIEEAIQIQKDSPAEDQYIDDLKQFVFNDRITVLTPKGKNIDLPSNATCIDFAYLIHTEVGNRAIRALVNGLNVPLDYQLKRGDEVKILTTDYPKSPSYEWLSFAKTPQARKKMSDYFKRESPASKVQNGRKMLQKEYDRAGLGLVNNLPNWKIKLAADKYSWLTIITLDDIFINIAEGNLSTLDVVNLFNPSESGVTEKSNSKNLAELSNDLKNLIKFRIKVVAEANINISKFVDVIQKRKDTVILVSSESHYSNFSKQLFLQATMFVRTFNDISTICREIEQLDGVIEVSRLFLSRKIFFFLASIFIFIFWAIHPYALYLITTTWQASDVDVRFVANLVLFAGLFILFSLIFFLQQFTNRSFPEFRENNRLWFVAYVLSFFALITIFLEIYLYKLHFDWPWVLGGAILLFAYLTGQYIYSKDKIEN